MLLNALVAIGISHMTEKPPQEVFDLVDRIRVPRAD
jgi:hypothetical protein